MTQAYQYKMKKQGCADNPCLEAREYLQYQGDFKKRFAQIGWVIYEISLRSALPPLKFPHHELGRPLQLLLSDSGLACYSHPCSAIQGPGPPRERPVKAGEHLQTSNSSTVLVQDSGVLLKICFYRLCLGVGGEGKHNFMWACCEPWLKCCPIP